MPSSSLFQRSSTTLISVLSLILAPALATDFQADQSTSPSSSSSSSGYQLQKTYKGNDFFNDFTFFDQADPTHGYVTYVSESDAKSRGLASVQSNGAFRMKVDDKTVLTQTTDYSGHNGVGRASVRIEGKETYNKGLWIADFSHMPDSTCGLWPAYWTLAKDVAWPYGGEIDMVEGVNNRDYAIAALHDGYESKITGDPKTQTGTLLSTDCQYYPDASDTNSAGCASKAESGSYGTGFNAGGGRVIAMEWTDQAIKVWSFPRSKVPKDIGTSKPDPSKWGLPTQTFSGPDVNIPQNFKPQQIIVDTTFCGDFAEAVWQSEGCAASTKYDRCADYVAGNPTAFSQAYWDINSIRVYQKPAGSSSFTTMQPTTSTSSTLSATSTSYHHGNGTYTHGSTETTASVTTETGSSWADWIEPSDQKTGVPQSGIGFPQGTGVPTPGSWATWSLPVTPTLTKSVSAGKPTGPDSGETGVDGMKVPGSSSTAGSGSTAAWDTWSAPSSTSKAPEPTSSTSSNTVWSSWTSPEAQTSTAGEPSPTTWPASAPTAKTSTSSKSSAIWSTWTTPEAKIFTLTSLSAWSTWPTPEAKTSTTSEPSTVWSSWTTPEAGSSTPKASSASERSTWTTPQAASSHPSAASSTLWTVWTTPVAVPTRPVQAASGEWNTRSLGANATTPIAKWTGSANRPTGGLALEIVVLGVAAMLML